MRRANRILSLLLAACLLFSMSLTGTVSAASALSIYVNGTKISMDADPIIVNDRTLVPMTAIVDHIGGASGWDGDARTASFSYNGTYIELTIGSTTAMVNGSPQALDVAPQIVTVDRHGGGRTMVPLRFVAEAFHFNVDWNGEKQAVYIDSLPEVTPGETIGIIVNDVKLRLDADPIMVNNRTLVPVSTIVDFLGGTADWRRGARPRRAGAEPEQALECL